MGGAAVTFERLELLALAPLLILTLSLSVTAQWRRGVRLVDAYGGREAATRLASRDLWRFPTSRLVALVVAGAALTIAAAGPGGAADPTPESERPMDLVIALDISLSMAAEDIGSSRVERATEVVTRLTDALPEERVGVAVFAGWPYTLVPLTDDPNVVRFFTESLHATMVAERDQGTSLGAVVVHARRTLESRRRPAAEPVILLLTDGEAHDDGAGVLDSVAAAATDGVRLWTAGLGTEAGGPLAEPESEGTFLVDANGTPVVARMNEPLLRDIAATGGGSYHDVSDERGLRALLDDLTGVARDTDAEDGSSRLALWLTLLGLALLVWEGTADSGRRLKPSTTREESS